MLLYDEVAPTECAEVVVMMGDGYEAFVHLLCASLSRK